MSPFFEMMLVTQLWSTTAITITYLATLTCFSIIGLSLKERLRSIQIDISEMDPNSFLYVIRRQIKAYLFFAKFNQVFAPVILTKHVMMAIYICNCGFQFVEVILCVVKKTIVSLRIMTFSENHTSLSALQP